jgi:hypothetical protein
MRGFVTAHTALVRFCQWSALNSVLWSKRILALEQITMTAESYVTADDVAEHLKITRRQVN